MMPHPLRVERELRGWSQARVAEAVGTNVRAVIRWEQRQAIPSPYYRERLCVLFGKNASELGLLSDPARSDNRPVSERAEVQDEPLAFSSLTLPPSTSAHPSAPGLFWKVPPTLLPLVGRTREIEEIRHLLMTTEVRLLTLTGAGGIGKTRLSLQLAHELWSHFPDGVCFISLATAREPEQVMSIIAYDLELPDESGPPFERVQRALREKQRLLLLDNFEQVAQAAPELERLLVNCPGLKVLVTSRVVLGLPRETQYRLSPLPLPDLKDGADSAAVARSPSVQLFVQRARTLLPTFQMNRSDAVALAKICIRLDGMPLAIELAAARVKLLPPQTLLPRLSRSLQVLTKALPAGPVRQQTLRNTITWSYNLLNAGEQRFFRLLSLFVSGFTVEAAEALFAAVIAVDEGEATAALDVLDVLIDNSLLQPAVSIDEDSEPRLQMLETIREFGNERLLESSDREAARQAYAAYYLKLAEEAAQEIQGPQRKKWLDRLDQEHGNLQAVMEWLLSQEDVVPAAIKRTVLQEQALRLANALNQFWTQRGYLNEGWRFVEQVLLAYDGGDTLPLARAYLLAASLSMRLGNLERAAALVEQGINCGNALGNKVHLAQSLRMSGWIAHQSGQGNRAYRFYEQSLALFKELDDRKEITNTMHNMAFLLQTRGDSEQANALLEEVVTRQRALHNKTGLYGALYQLALSLFSLDEQPPLERIHALLLEGLALAEEAGDQRGIAGIQGLLGWVIFSEGQLSEARKLVEGCLLFYNSGGDREFYGQYLGILGEIRAAQGDYAAARSVFEESLAIGKELSGKSEITAVALEGLADLELALGEYERAVRLWAKAARQREEIDVPLMRRLRPARERSLDQLRTLLGEKTFTDQWEQGYKQSPDEM